MILNSFLCSDGCAAETNHPILVLASNAHFGSYIGEILKAEGFAEFEILPFTNNKISLKYLKDFDIIILAETISGSMQAGMLGRYVKEGGNLISVIPDKKMKKVLGVVEGDGSFNNGYFLVDTNAEIGKGITSKSIQLHTKVDKYLLDGGKKIATFLSDRINATQFPAIVMNKYYKGHAIGFLYNLPENIVYTRQGNFKNAAMEMDGIPGIRAMDMFTDGWVDPSNNIVNPADEQMRLFGHCIERMSAYTKPLPRFWYFPDTLQCLVTLTNDGEYKSEEDFRPQFRDIESKGAKMALYVLRTDQVSRMYVDSLASKGNEVSGHPDDTKEATHPTWRNMNNALEEKTAVLNQRFGIFKMRTVVNHWFVWCGTREDGSTDFAAQAKLELKHNVEMDINYAHYDNNSTQAHFLGPMGMNQGNFTGSGLAMKFADKEGVILDIFQVLNNVYDQQYMENKDSVGFYECFKGLMDRSLNDEVYSLITIKSHNDEYFFSRTPLLKMLDYANEKQVPVWTPDKLLDFLKVKEEAVFTNIKYFNNHFSFQIRSSLAFKNGLTCMVPYLYNGKKTNKITVNRTDSPYSVKLIKGVKYALVTIKPGATYDIVVNYN